MIQITSHLDDLAAHLEGACSIKTKEKTFPTDGVAADLKRDVDDIIQEITQRIIAATDSRPLFSQTAGRELSLQEAAGLIVQSQDSQFHQDTPALTASLSAEAKILLGYVVTELGKQFIDLNPEDLKVISLLFGASRIAAIAANALKIASERPILEGIKANLSEVMSSIKPLRSKYPKIEDFREGEDDNEYLPHLDSVVTKIQDALTLITSELNDLSLLEAFFELRN